MMFTRLLCFFTESDLIRAINFSASSSAPAPAWCRERCSVSLQASHMWRTTESPVRPVPLTYRVHWLTKKFQSDWLIPSSTVGRGILSLLSWSLGTSWCPAD